MMKIAVTSQGPDLNSQVDPRFGRTGSFIVVETDTNEFSVHDNKQNANAAQGAGIQAARAVADLGVEAILTGNVGPKAFAALQAAKVTVYPGTSGNVKEAVANFKAGELQPADGANVEGHWM